MMQLVRTDYLCSVGLFMPIKSDKTCRLHVDVMWCLDTKTRYTISAIDAAGNHLVFIVSLSIKFLIISVGGNTLQVTRVT